MLSTSGRSVELACEPEAEIIRALLGERSVYPRDAPGRNGYFEHTAGYQSSWACNDPTWTGDNPSCVRSGINIDGVLVEDASRGGGCCVLQGDGIMYSWEALQGLFVSVELLYRTGNYGNPYNWSNNALKRSWTFCQDLVGLCPVLRGMYPGWQTPDTVRVILRPQAETEET